MPLTFGKVRAVCHSGSLHTRIETWTLATVLRDTEHRIVVEYQPGSQRWRFQGETDPRRQYHSLEAICRAFRWRLR